MNAPNTPQIDERPKTNIPLIDELLKKIEQLPDEQLVKSLGKLAPLEDGEVAVGQLTPELLRLLAYKEMEDEAIDEFAENLLKLAGKYRSEAMETAINDLVIRKHELEIMNYLFERSVFLIVGNIKNGVSIRQEGVLVELPPKPAKVELEEPVERPVGRLSHGSLLGDNPLISILISGGCKR